MSSATALAVEGSTEEPALEPQPEEAQRESPRAAVQSFLELSRAGRFAEAGRFLDVPKSDEGDRADLARRLKAVLDRRLWIDL
jgi:MscS family membrane protein